MKRSLLTAVACAFATASVFAQGSTYFAQISGHQQVPSVASLAEGRVSVRLNGDSIIITAPDTFELTSPLATNIGVHIHTGYAGQNGPVVVPLPYRVTSANAVKIRDTVLLRRTGFVDTLRMSMQMGRNYINVHSLNYTGGEVRGQLVPTTAATTSRYDAMLYGDHENPAVLTEGMGGIVVEVRSDSMFFSGAFTLESPLSPVGGTGAHIHSGFFGQNGGIVLALQPTMSDDGLSGTFTRARNAFARDTAVLNPMLRRSAYVNIHSVAYPGGEIRGQLVPLGTNLYPSHVSYNTPTAFPNANAYLRVLAEKVPNENRIRYSGSWSGWGQEIRERKLRVVATVTNPFNSAGGTATLLQTAALTADSSRGVVRLAGFPSNTPDQIEGLFLRLSSASGWLVGSGATARFAYSANQYHECKRAFFTYLTASQEVPANASRGYGEITTEYYGTRVDITGAIEGLENALDPTIQGGFHIHDALAGRGGPIVAPVTYVPLSNDGKAIAFLPDQAQVNLTPELAARMKERGFYYNIHTVGYPAGEIRGQILPQSNTVYQSVVEPAQAVPGGVVTDGDGVVLVEAYGSKMTASGTFNQLTGFAPNVAGGAHLHAGLPGITGGIKYGLRTSAGVGAAAGEFLPDDNTFVTTAATMDSLTNRAFYVNIHTQKAPSGEIRGQVGPLATNVVHARLSTAVTKPYTGMLGMSMGRGNLHGEIFDTTVVMYGNFTGLSSAIDTNIMGGAHIHIGKVAKTGIILVPLKLQLSNVKDTAATVTPRANVTEIPPAQRGAFLFGGLYANVHTANAPSGAIRGQVLLSENQYPDSVKTFTFPADNATVDLKSGTATSTARVAWERSGGPDPEQNVAYIWQLFTDTTAAPVVQTTVDTANSVSFTFGALDTLLNSLGVDSGRMATVYHRAWTTDGSLITPGKFSTVTFTRFGTVGVGELPAGSARLINNVSAAGGNLFLELDALPAGRYRYDMIGASGQVLASAPLDHAGASQRYELTTPQASAGIYFLRLSNERGEASTWGFLVK